MITKNCTVENLLHLKSMVAGVLVSMLNLSIGNFIAIADYRIMWNCPIAFITFKLNKLLKKRYEASKRHDVATVWNIIIDIRHTVEEYYILINLMSIQQ